MSGADVVRARKACGWKQRQLAEELGVSQPYVSLLERNRRNVPTHMARRLSRVLKLSPNTLPMGLTKMPLASQQAASALGRFGYPGFAYLRRGSTLNPAEMLVRTLEAKNVEARLVEALPWVLLKYPNLDWDWLLREVKVRDLQNRLGFVVTMARELAEHRGEVQTAQTLSHWERVLEHSRLQREDGFRESLTNAERNWLRANRSEEAVKWNVLSNLSNTALYDAF
jgi:transcriptional regulator with XRE-family HTH domain